MERPLQLINFGTSKQNEKTKAQIDFSVVNHVLDQCGGHPICVISICGPTRQGKSFLLGYMIRYLEALEKGQNEDWMGSKTNKSKPLTGFRFENKVDPLTKGIWIWSRPFIVFCENKPVSVLLIDTQGTGDEFTTETEMNTIVSLSLLFSSMMIFNFFKDFDEKTLSVFDTYIQYGLLAREKEDRKPFQNITFLVRDWNIPGQYPFGATGGQAYFNELLKLKAGQPTETQRVRKSIKDCFDQATCFLMPFIGEKALEPKFTGSISELAPDFVTHLKEFIGNNFVAKKLVKKTVLGEIVTGAEFKAHLKSFVQLFNSDEIPKAITVWEATLQTTSRNLVAKAYNSYVDRMNAAFARIGEGEYLPEHVIKECHAQEKRKAQQLFEDASKFGSIEQQQEFEELLFHQIYKEASVLETENKLKRREFISKAEELAKQELEKELDKFQAFPTAEASVQLFHEPELFSTFTQKALAQVVQTFEKRFTQETNSARKQLVDKLKNSLDPIICLALTTNLVQKEKAEAILSTHQQKLVSEYGSEIAEVFKKNEFAEIKDFADLHEKIKSMKINSLMHFIAKSNHHHHHLHSEKWVKDLETIINKKFENQLALHKLYLNNLLSKSEVLAEECAAKYKTELEKYAAFSCESHEDLKMYHQRSASLITTKFNHHDNPYPNSSSEHLRLSGKLEKALNSILQSTQMKLEQEKMSLDGMYRVRIEECVARYKQKMEALLKEPVSQEQLEEKHLDQILVEKRFLKDDARIKVHNESLRQANLPRYLKELERELTSSFMAIQLTFANQQIEVKRLEAEQKALIAMAINLPSTLKEFMQIFGDDLLVNIMRKAQSRSTMSPAQAVIWKYSGGAVLSSRPLNTVMIFMAGVSGCGKSTTINVLFEDAHLCSTSSSTSETKEPVRLRKILRVFRESPPVVGNLTFVDVPGAFDTDEKNDVVNFASIRKFRENCEELQSREELALAKLNMQKIVYPNVVLFVVKAQDNRIVGLNSNLRKSLESFKLLELFDKKHPNLIIVLSHARSLGGESVTFEKDLEEKTRHIRQLTEEILGVSDVDVVPVENDGNGQALEKSGDFYVLPNGELSHYNLFQAMKKIFNRNGDLMGKLFVGWYFGTNCPEKKEKVVVDASKMELEAKDVAFASKQLQKLNLPVAQDSTFPEYNFHNLGCGYCPVTEEVKPVFLLSENGDALSTEKSKIVEIEDSKFCIPDFINAYVKKTSRFQRLSFYEKEEYQTHMQASYGLEVGFKLIVSASSEGRWISDGRSSYSSSLIRMIQEIQVATFKLDNPRGRVLHSDFLQELHRLPSTYNKETAKEFRSFFSKWGTHIIYEEAVGGAITLNCTLQRSMMSKEKLAEIEGEVSAIFKGFSGSANMQFMENSRGLKTAGVSNEHLEIEGGDPPQLISLESANSSQQLQVWAPTISKKPVELRQSIKLYPYYNLLDSGPQYESLREATAEYLESTLNARIMAVVKRNDVAEETVREVVKSFAPSCFPRGTLVEAWNGERIPIEQLSAENSQLKTISFLNSPFNSNLKLEKLTKTSFCTFLDVKPTELVEYLVFHCSNNKKLIVSRAHLIFQYIPDSNRVFGKQAKCFKTGERTIYLNPGSGEIETPVIMSIAIEMHVGAFSPLTESGTFFADGFLVSSYANTNSFLQAQMVLLPLKTWCKLKRNKTRKQRLCGYNDKKSTTVTTDGIHPFAKFLMSLRKLFTSFHHLHE